MALKIGSEIYPLLEIIDFVYLSLNVTFSHLLFGTVAKGGHYFYS